MTNMLANTARITSKPQGLPFIIALIGKGVNMTLVKLDG
jgi:hypothetical protein